MLGTQDHADEEYIWNTDCALYEELDTGASVSITTEPAAATVRAVVCSCLVGPSCHGHGVTQAAKESKGSHGRGGFEGLNEVRPSGADRTGMMIQDVVLPGYYDEWVAPRKVRTLASMALPTSR